MFPSNSRFLVVGDVSQQLFLHRLFSDLFIHRDQQLLGLGVHISHIHPSLMVKQHIVALPGGVDTDVELLLLNNGHMSIHTSFFTRHFILLLRLVSSSDKVNKVRKNLNVWCVMRALPAYGLQTVRWGSSWERLWLFPPEDQQQIILFRLWVFLY